MRTILYPDREKWDVLTRRPGLDKSDLEASVRNIIDTVKNDKDRAVDYFSRKFDGAPSGNLTVSQDEIAEAPALVADDLKAAINMALKNIEKFHSAQLINEPVVQIARGIKCWRRSVPIEKVGLYIPGGSAPLFSTVLMLGIPAMIAGCKEIILCTPPGQDGKINPAILYTAKLSGITKIFRAGGAQAIAAMAYGTESIPKVYKIFGPGNQYVTKAKELIQQDGIAIDMPAGPSEVLVIADAGANPEFIVADLLSQAEHGSDSQVIMVTDSEQLIDTVIREVEVQLKNLPRKDIASKALENSMLILMRSLSDCLEFSNLYAPEHLIFNTKNYMEMADKVINAGSVFLGKYSCESAGDYASGTNHTLPTNGYARNYSGVSTDSFLKKITFQEITEEGIEYLGKSIEVMAEAESLNGHKNAVSVRLNKIPYV